MSVLSEEIKKAKNVLYQGGIILYPTDTIWGIGCDATNEKAVQKIYEIKRRAESKSMLVLVDSFPKLSYYLREVPDLAYDLTDLSEKPLTIIYEGARNLASNLIAEDGSIGIRITTESFSKGLCQTFRKAIVSTSANRAGEPSPRCFQEISEEILKAVDYVVDYRQEETEAHSASSIIKLGLHGDIKIIRE